MRKFFFFTLLTENLSCSSSHCVVKSFHTLFYLKIYYFILFSLSIPLFFSLRVRCRLITVNEIPEEIKKLQIRMKIVTRRGNFSHFFSWTFMGPELSYYLGVIERESVLREKSFSVSAAGCFRFNLFLDLTFYFFFSYLLYFYIRFFCAGDEVLKTCEREKFDYWDFGENSCQFWIVLDWFLKFGVRTKFSIFSIFLISRHCKKYFLVVWKKLLLKFSVVLKTYLSDVIFFSKFLDL